MGYYNEDLFPVHKHCYFDGLEQDCSNSIALAMELLQSCPKPTIYRSCLLISLPKKFSI